MSAKVVIQFILQIRTQSITATGTDALFEF